MAKLTRQQYRRKRLFTGVVMFVSAVLVVTGVAVWLLLGSLTESAGGGISVAEVATSPLKFNAIRIDGENVEKGKAKGAGFQFDAPENDRSGHLQWKAPGAEKLSIDVEGVILGADYLKGFAYALELPQGVIDAAAKGYIDISEFYDADTGAANTLEFPLEKGTKRGEGASSTWTFRFTISLKWGETFGGMNPSVYYDEIRYPGDAWTKEAEAEVSATLADFRALVEENNTGFQLKLFAYAN